MISFSHVAAHHEAPPREYNSATLPWPHQREAYQRFAAAESGMLALDMGTGKTKVAIDLVQNNASPSTVLVVCPRYVVDVWGRELARHLVNPRSASVRLLGAGKLAARALAIREAVEPSIYEITWIIINYEALDDSGVQAAIKDHEWGWIILDESHRIKAAMGRRSKFLANAYRFSRRRLCLTGTPMPHSPLDVFGQFRFLDPAIFGTRWTAFRARYAVTHQFYKTQILKYINQDELSARVAAYTFQVRADDVLDLPEIVHVVRTCELEEGARRVYEEMKDEFIAEVEHGEIVAANAAVKLGKLRQMTGGAVRDAEGQAHLVSTAKAELLADLLGDLGEAPVVVFAAFHTDLDAIADICLTTKSSFAELSGRTGPSELARWQAGEAQVLIAQIDAAREGIDLTRAATAIYYSLGFSLGNYDQSLARLRRPGQERRVTYLHLLAADTVDFYVYAALEQRREIIEYVLSRLIQTGGTNDNENRFSIPERRDTRSRR